MKKIYILLPAILILISLSNKGFAYQLYGYKWTGGSYNYKINPIGVDNSVNYSSYSNVIINAAAEWESVSTTDVSVNYLGTTTNTGWQVNDGENVVSWKTDGWSGTVIGLSTAWYSGSSIVDSDIKLNTAFAGDSRLTQLVTHEVGHSLGIGHTKEQGYSATQDEYDAIMYWQLHSQTELNNHDKCAITAVYPSSGSCSPSSSAGYYECIPCCAGGAFVSADISNNSYTYDGTSKSVTVITTPSGLAYTVTYTDALLNVVASPTSAGTYNVTVTITESGYESEGPFYGTLTISKRTLYVTANNKTVNYGDAEPAYTVSYSNFASGDDQSDLTVAPTADIAASWPANPGTYTIYVSGGADDNYKFNYTNGTLTVNGLEVNALYADDLTHTYDGTNKVISITTDPPGVSYSVQYKLNGISVPSQINAGAYDVTVTIVETGYNQDKFYGTMTINKANLTASANDIAIMLGDPEPTYTIDYSGFENGETESVLDTKPVADVAGSWPLPAGSYTIDVSGGSDNNYNIIRVDGTLTIAGNTADSVKFSNMEYTYDGFSHSPSITTYPNGLDYNVVYTNSYSHQVFEPLDAGNYSIDVIITESGYVRDTFSTVFTIEKADLEITANDTTVVFGSAEPEYELSYSGFLNFDNKYVLDLPPTVGTQQEWPLLPGTYDIEIHGGDDNNYNLIFTSGILTIEEAKVDSIVFSHFEYTYDGFPHEATLNVYPPFPNLNITYYDSLNYIANGPYNAGIYQLQAIVDEPGFAVDTFAHEFIIEKAPLLVKAASDTVDFGNPEPEYLINYEGFVLSDNKFTIDSLPTAEVAGDWPLLPGEYEITFIEGWDNNYEMTYEPGILVVESKNAALLISDTIKTYNGLPQEATINIVPDGLMNEIMYFDEFNNSIGIPYESGEYKISVLITEVGYDSLTKSAAFVIAPDTLLVEVDDYTINFGEEVPEFTYTINGFIDGEDESAIQIMPQVDINFVGNSVTGEFEIIASGAKAMNYVFEYQNGKLTINPLLADITIYDTITTYNGLPRQITVNTQPENISYTVKYFDEFDTETLFPVQAGAYSYKVIIDEIGYDSISLTGNFKIEKANMLVTADTVEINYGQDFHLPELHIDGFVNGEEIGALFIQPTIEIISVLPTDAGTYEFEISGGEALNYQFSYSTFVLEINKSTLTVSPDDFSISYNDPLPDFTYQLAGFQYSDDETVLTALPQLYIEGNEPFAPGNHPIMATGAEADNYTFNYETGNLWIEPIGDVSIEVISLDTVYTGNQYWVSANIIPENIAYSIEYENAAIDAGTYDVIAKVTEPGYIQAISTGSITIAKAPLNVIVKDETVLLGDEEPEYQLNYTGFVNNENEGVLDQLPLASIDQTWESAVAGTYAIVAANGNDNNYNFIYHEGTLTIIQTYIIQVTAGENGWVSFSEKGELLDNIQERVAINENSSVFYAVPADNYKFTNWDNGSTDNPISFQNIQGNIQVSAIFESKVGVDQIDTQDWEIKVYPNPIRAMESFFVNITIPDEQYAASKLLLTDVMGRIITKTEVSSAIELSGLKPGVYQLHLINENYTPKTIKLLVR